MGDAGKQNSSSLGIKNSIQDDKESEKVTTNGNAVQKEEKKEDKPFFVMWNSQDDYESDKEEDGDSDKDADAEESKGTESSSGEVADEKVSEQSQNVNDDDEDLFDSIAKPGAKRKVSSKTELNGNSV